MKYNLNTIYNYFDHMPLLSNEYLNATCLIDYFEKAVQSGRPLRRQHVEKTIKAIFFNRDILTDAETVTLIQKDTRFSSYPLLKSILIYLLTCETIDVDLLKTFEERDWTPEASSQFERYNSQYHYFSSEDTKIKELYTLLVQACRAMIVFIERNNTPEETMAYEYAYKIMAITVDHIDRMPLQVWFEEISKNIDKLTYTLPERNKCYHEMLLVRLTLPQDINDREGWIKLIRKHGAHVFPAFSMANRVEEKNGGKAPSNWEETETIIAQLMYQRAIEDPEFAEMCEFYSVQEERFNQCLNYMRKGWPKKIDDVVPKVVTEYKGYIWEKMPPWDKHSLILGDITVCCQSIGGNSEQCVKDAVSLPSNGLYILKNSKGHIIGQSYVWISTSGNLCLDSIECRLDSIRDDDLQTILVTFANQVFESYPSIKRVTLGTRGKTPENLFPNTFITEKMREGHHYGDADFQYCIAKKPLQMTQEQKKSLYQLLEQYPTSFRESLLYLLEQMEEMADVVSALIEILQEDPDLPQKLTPEKVDFIFSLSQFFKLDDLKMIDVKTLQSMSLEQLRTISTTRLVWQRTTSEVADIIDYIPEKDRFKIINELNLLKEITNQPEKLKKVIQALSKAELLAIIKENVQNSNPLASATGHPESLRLILEIYPEEERLKAILSLQETFFYSIHLNLERLQVVLEMLPENHRYELIQKIRQTERTSLADYASKNPEKFRIMLQSLSKRNRLYAIENDHLLDSYWDYRSTETQKMILALYTEQEFLIRVNPDAFNLSIISPIEMIFSHYSLETGLKIFEMKDSTGERLLDKTKENKNKLTNLLLNAFHLKNINEIDAYTHRLLCVLTSNPGALQFFIGTLRPQEEVLSLIMNTNEDEENILHIAARHNPKALNILLKELKIRAPQMILSALMKINLDGENVLHLIVRHENSVLEQLLDILPAEKISDLITTENNDRKSVLHESVKNSKNFKTLLNVLPFEAILSEWMKDVAVSSSIYRYQSMADIVLKPDFNQDEFLAYYATWRFEEKNKLLKQISTFIHPNRTENENEKLRQFKEGMYASLSLEEHILQAKSGQIDCNHFNKYIPDALQSSVFKSIPAHHQMLFLSKMETEKRKKLVQGWDITDHINVLFLAKSNEAFFKSYLQNCVLHEHKEKILRGVQNQLEKALIESHINPLVSFLGLAFYTEKEKNDFLTQRFQSIPEKHKEFIFYKLPIQFQKNIAKKVGLLPISHKIQLYKPQLHNPDNRTHEISDTEHAESKSPFKS